jgi:hypothetical protein
MPSSPISSVSSVSPEDLQPRTLFYERLRAVTLGVVETAAGTFLLLIAVKHFHSGATAKALLAASINIGLLLTPLVLHWTAKSRRRTSKVAAWICGAGSLGFYVAALVPDETVFVAGSVIAVVCTTSIIPLLTQIYQDNYPVEKRGTLYSQANIIRIAVAAGFAYIAGELLQTNMERYQWLMLVFAVGMTCSALCLYRIPAQAIRRDAQHGPFHALRFIRSDPIFRRTLLSWMVMGFANLVMVPLRIEYMANPQYGLFLTASMIALLNTTIPHMARLALSPLWGRLFDNANFFVMRIALNAGFCISILAFFTGDSTAGLITGSIIFGIAASGGDVAWALWVTKMAPPEHVADYMSVHTFFTGIRGVIAPIFAFHVLGSVSIAVLATGCSVLIVIASSLLIPEALAAKRARERQASTPEVPAEDAVK